MSNKSISTTRYLLTGAFGMNKSIIASVVFLFLIIAFSSSEGVTVIKRESIVAQTNVQSMTPSGDYTPHRSIIISSNADFSSQGWPGSGTPADPFIIEWLDLTHYDTCISIRNTDVYFEIRNCLISFPSVYSSPEEGIHFVTVMHGTIFNCIIEQHYVGVSLYNSGNCILYNNTVINNRGFGFKLERSDTCTLTNNTVTNSDYGFSLLNSDNCMLANNTVSNNDYGIYLVSLKSCTLTSNTVTNSDYGFSLLYSENCILINNTLFENGVVIDGNSILHYFHEISGNTVNGKFLGYFVNLTNTIVDCYSYAQIILANCTGVTAKGGTYTNVTIGIQVSYCSNCSLMNNTASYNSLQGFILRNSNNCTIIDNTATNNDYGFYLHSSDNCTLMNNTASNNLLEGFYMMWSENCTLSNNRASEFFLKFSAFCILMNNSGSKLSLEYSRNSILINNTCVQFSVTSSGYCILTDNTASGYSYYSFYLRRSDYCILMNNTASGAYSSGFILEFSDYCILIDNDVSDGYFYGFDLTSSSKCTLTNNTLINSGIVISGESISHWLHNLSGNIINNKPLGYFVNLTNAIIDCSQYSQLILANCTDVIARDGIFTDVSIGVQIAFCVRCSILNNVVINNHEYGFYLENSTYCVLRGNTASNNSKGYCLSYSNNCFLMNNIASGRMYGFQLVFSNNCMLTNNIAINNTYSGFCLYRSNNSTITNNTANTCLRYGVWIWITDNCTLMDNNATDNKKHGFYIYFSTNCILVNNNASSNSFSGFQLNSSDHCILINNTAYNNLRLGIGIDERSNSNVLYLNKLGKNGIFNAWDDGELNAWDDGVSCGNYWMDYDGEGVYLIPGSTGNVDNFPFVWKQAAMTYDITLILILSTVGLVVVVIAVEGVIRKRKS